MSGRPRPGGRARRRASAPQLRRGPQPRGQASGGQLQADEKRSEEGVDGAYFVETHFVNQLFEDQRVFGKQVDAPLPVVKADRAADDLAHVAGVAAANQINHRKPDGDTLFAVGSLSKGYLAAVTALLVDEGKLSWDDTLETLLPQIGRAHV